MENNSAALGPCIVCGSALTLLGVFHDMPASAQDIPDAEEIKTEGPVDLPLCQCMHCGLVQFSVEPVHYYKDVIRAGGGTKTMTRLRHAEYKRLLSYLAKTQNRHPKILEVGCGRGEFLSMWENLWEEDEEILPAEPTDVRAPGFGERDRGEYSPLEGATETAEVQEDIKQGEKPAGEAADLAAAAAWHAEESARVPAAVLQRIKPKLYGIEHWEKLVPEAQEKGLSVRRDFAEGEKLFEDAPFDAFVQFNFLEHQPHPLDMLKTIHKNLKDGGYGLLTVPSFEYILQHNGYYELLRDHIANYTEETLRYVCQEAGFEVLEERIVNRDTIEVILRKAEPETLSYFQFRGCTDIAPLLANYEQLKRDLEAYLSGLREKGRKLAIWGASHQGFTLAASTGLGGQVRYIIDSAAFKQGKYAPASHIPIVAPEHFFTEPVEEILIVAPGYTEEIAGIIRERFGPSVKILVLRGKEVEEFS